MAKSRSYAPPQFQYGQIVFDDVRGEVEIVGLSDATIPWPIGKKRNAKSLVVYKDLSRAIHFESNATVCELWGITPQTVSKWRKELGVERMNAGTLRRFSDMITLERKAKMQASLEPTRRDPARIEKIRQSKIGIPRPKRVREALRNAHVGRKWTAEERQQHLEIRIRRHPKNYAPWSAEEDWFVRTHSIRRVVELTGRSKGVVELRRKELGITRQSAAAPAARMWNDYGRESK